MESAQTYQLGFGSEWWKDLTKKQAFPRAAVDKFFVRNPQNLHDAGKLFLLVLAWEDREAGVEFGHDTPQAPHIDGHMIAHPENHFR